MKGIIFYCSGSGNTRLACQYIAGKTIDIKFDLLDIITDDIPDIGIYDIAGFATYTSFLNIPYVFQRFIEKLPPQNNKPAFVFNTYGYVSGKTLKLLNVTVAAKGFRVITGHSLHMPESYPPMIARGMGNEQAPNEKEMDKFNKFVFELDQLVYSLKSGGEPGVKKIRTGLLNSLMPAYHFTKAREDMGEKYVDDSLCTECGLCEKLCPYKAIRCSPKPVFDMDKCYGCWTCYNHCPSRAIFTVKYRGTGHYPQPISKLKEKLKIE